MPVVISRRLEWKDFEDRVRNHFKRKLGWTLARRKLTIGFGNMRHEFDLVSEDGRIVVECKSYTWTVTGNFPQAKISTANEAIFFLSRINANRKILILQDDVTDGRSLAQEYVRRYDGIMDDVEIWRYLTAEDESDDVVEIVRKRGPVWHQLQQ